MLLEPEYTFPFLFFLFFSLFRWRSWSPQIPAGTTRHCFHLQVKNNKHSEKPNQPSILVRPAAEHMTYTMARVTSAFGRSSTQTRKAHSHTHARTMANPTGSDGTRPTAGTCTVVMGSVAVFCFISPALISPTFTLPFAVVCVPESKDLNFNF